MNCWQRRWKLCCFLLDWIRGEDSGVFGASAFELESEPPLTLISARVKSERIRRVPNSMRADLTNDQLGRVGADCDGGRSELSGGGLGGVAN